MKSRRLSGLAVSVFGVLLTAQPLNRLTAQHFSVGPQIVFGDYREVSADQVASADSRFCKKPRAISI